MACNKCGYVTASATTYPYSENVWQCPSCGYLQGKTVEKVARIAGKAVVEYLEKVKFI